MSILVKTPFQINNINIKRFKCNFFFFKYWSCVSSLNDISLYLKQKKAWIHHRKVLDSLCSRSCIVPFEILKQKNCKRIIPNILILKKLKSIITVKKTYAKILCCVKVKECLFVWSFKFDEPILLRFSKNLYTNWFQAIFLTLNNPPPPSQNIKKNSVLFSMKILKKYSRGTRTPLGPYQPWRLEGRQKYIYICIHILYNLQYAIRK